MVMMCAAKFVDSCDFAVMSPKHEYYSYVNAGDRTCEVEVLRRNLTGRRGSAWWYVCESGSQDMVNSRNKNDLAPAPPECLSKTIKDNCNQTLSLHRQAAVG